MPYHLAQLRREHGNFLKLLDLVEHHIEQFHAGQSIDYTLMLDVMHYLTHYIDPVHHAQEDRAFAQLARHDPAAAPLVAGLRAQHVIIAESGARLLQTLDAVINGALLPRTTVEVPARTYIAYLRAHVRQEEAQLFPRLASVLRSRDWRLIERDARIKDPLFSDAVSERYRRLHEQIARHAGCGCATEAA